MSRAKTRNIFNILIAVTVFCAWFYMMTRGKNGGLMATGLWSLKFFTTLSNLFEGCVSLYLLLGKNKTLAEKLKFYAAIYVGVTFVVVVAFLGSIYGYRSMFVGPNLWFHLIVPLAAIAEDVIFSEWKPSGKDCLYTAAGVLIYAVFYLGNIAINGYRGNDWYAIFAFGIPIGIGIFSAIVLLAVGLGFMIRYLAFKIFKHIN